MMRMVKMELVVFGQYLKQLLFTMAFTVTCVAVGVGSISIIPSTAFVVMIFSFSMAGAVYDEQNAWGAYRMAMPLSRRDVVFGRYAFNLFTALGVSLIAAVITAVLVALGTMLPVQGFVADLLVWNEDTTASAIAGVVSCMCIGLALNSITLPVFFKFGHTKATQWLPFIMLLLSVLPFVVMGMIGGEPFALLEQALNTAQATGGMGMIGFGALVVALVVYGVSACVSIKFYEARSL